MNELETKRISQDDEFHKNGISGILEQAEIVARGVLESVQTIAGTTACKGVQIAQLEKWSKTNNCWLDATKLGSYEDRGSENEVYLSYTENCVYKLNDFRYSDDNLSPFFERIKAHNTYFPYCAYSLIGFSVNKNGKTCAVLRQPYIISNREATQEEIYTELKKLGFNSQLNGEYYTNGFHDIFDASPNNVLVGIDGNLYFIDTIIYKTNANNLNTYQSQSPRFNHKI